MNVTARREWCQRNGVQFLEVAPDPAVTHPGNIYPPLSDPSPPGYDHYTANAQHHFHQQQQQHHQQQYGHYDVGHHQQHGQVNYGFNV